MDMKIELITVPVSDVDRAKEFYVKAGFNADHDQVVNENLRFVQLTPPGSACSICIGIGLTSMKPGSMESIQMVVADAQKAHDDLVARGIEVSDVTPLAWGIFVYFKDPDGNQWALQELPAGQAKRLAKPRFARRTTLPDSRVLTDTPFLYHSRTKAQQSRSGE